MTSQPCKAQIPVLLLIFLMEVVSISHAKAAKHALVIGNSLYDSAKPVSGVKDAELMASYLEQLGFNVPEPVRNGNLAQMRQSLADLESAIDNDSTSVVVFFFSGHGFQNNEDNYLMPVDDPGNPRSAISLKEIRDTLAQAPQAAIKLVFLDACRSPLGAPKPGLNTEKAPPLDNILYAFAAGPDQNAESGIPEGFSPYSMALLRHVREPGLNMIGLLSRVKADLDGFEQTPTYLPIGNVEDFTLQPPVIVQIEVNKADDNLLVVLNGEVVLDARELEVSKKPAPDLQLRAGENDLVLLVSNGNALHNGQTWGRTEGWSYDMAIRRNGAEILCKGNGQQVRCFKDDGEKVPFKEGPRHGKVFVVARAKLIVGLDAPTLSIEPDLRVWERESPVWASDQALLDTRSLAELNLSPEDVFADLGPWRILRPFLAEFLTSGKVLGKVVTDPNDTLFTVRGNRKLGSFVETCMTVHRADRIRDLKESVKLAIERESTPFTKYDVKLMQCIQEVGKESEIKPEDMRVWTAVETRRSLNQ